MKKKPKGYYTEGKGIGRKVRPIMPASGQKSKSRFEHPSRTAASSSHTQREIEEIQNPKGLKGIELERGYLTEREVNLMKTRMSRGTLEHSDIPFPDRGFKLSETQNQKGKKWLMNQWKGKSGKERKNNPFGYREQAVLENMDEIRLVDYYDTANYHQAKMNMHFYVPYYRVVAKDGSTFEYAVYGGQIHIMG